MTSTGERAPFNASASSSRTADSGTGSSITRRASIGVALASQSSSATDTNAGPYGRCIATVYARWIAAGTSCARAGSIAHFTYGIGSIVACSAYRNGSLGSIARVCCPATTTSGA